MVHRHTGSGDVIDHVVAGTNAVKGEFRLSGNRVVQLLDDGIIGATVPAAVTGRYTVTAEAGVAWVAGDRIYKTAANQTFTKTAAGNNFAGFVAAAKLAAAVVGEIILASPGE
jgi:hypothetical protein